MLKSASKSSGHSQQYLSPYKQTWRCFLDARTDQSLSPLQTNQKTFRVKTDCPPTALYLAVGSWHAPCPHCPCVVWKYSLRKKNSLLPVSVASNKPGLWVQEVIIENNALPLPARKCWGLSGAQNARWGYFSYCASDLGLIHTAVYWSRQPDQHHSLTQEGSCSPPLRKVPAYLRVEKEWLSFWSGVHLHCRVATREASMQTLASDLSRAALWRTGLPASFVTVALQRKGKVDHGEKKGQKSDCSYLKDDHS